MFESLVISDLLKTRYNRGLISNFYFWRNNLGDEVDLLIDHGTELVPVEIKSGETVTPDLFRSLNKWFRWNKTAPPAGFLVYGGRDSLVSGGVRVVSWMDAFSSLPL